MVPLLAALPHNFSPLPPPDHLPLLIAAPTNHNILIFADYP